MMHGFFDPATFAVACVAMAPVAAALLLVRDWCRRTSSGEGAP